MTDITIDRRRMLKAQAALAAAAAAGMAAPASAQVVTDRAQIELTWNKAPCRFCGTGCEQACNFAPCSGVIGAQF